MSEDLLRRIIAFAIAELRMGESAKRSSCITIPSAVPLGPLVAAVSRSIQTEPASALLLIPKSAVPEVIS